MTTCRLGKAPPPPTRQQKSATIAGVPYWRSELPPQQLPKRAKDGCLIFPDHPEFRPNLTPDEVLRLGAFGGGYFRSIRSSITKQTYKASVHEEFPACWFKGVDVSLYVTADTYDANINHYGATCGNSLEFWEGRGWMRSQDPYGWFQWYCRFFLGRRSSDDGRQISRWVQAIGEKGRWRTFLVGQCVRQGRTWNDARASPATRQTLLHWGYQLSKDDFNALAPAIRKGKTVIYMGVAKKRPASKPPESARVNKRQRSA